MEREKLVEEAEIAGQCAVHNLRWIQSNPNSLMPGKIDNAKAYLNRMIRFAKAEKKNARRLGRTQLRTRLKNLVTSILTEDERKGKGETA